MWFIAFICLIVLGAGLFCVAAGIVMFRVLCVRRVYMKKSPVDFSDHVKDNRIMDPLLEAKERWAVKPVKKITMPMQAFWVFRLFSAKALSKKQLVGDLWLQPSTEKKKIVAVLVHGFSDSAAGMAYLAESYYERGCSVLSVNLRAHGESDGRFTGLGYLKTDAEDLARWVAYIKESLGDDTHIILHGVSMGGVTVLQCAFGLSAPIAFAVEDCGFSDFSAYLKNHLRVLLSSGFLSRLAVSGIVFVASCINFFVNGFFFSQNSPKNIIKNAKKSGGKGETGRQIPLLLFHGANDKLVKPSASEELFAVASDPKEIITVENAPHIGSWFYDKEKYMNTIFVYVDKYIYSDLK
ncbi:MAG: alpha/beta fold hydrolase [Spirochaetales bacterium]